MLIAVTSASAVLSAASSKLFIARWLRAENSAMLLLLAEGLLVTRGLEMALILIMHQIPTRGMASFYRPRLHARMHARTPIHISI